MCPKDCITVTDEDHSSIRFPRLTDFNLFKGGEHKQELIQGDCGTVAFLSAPLAKILDE